MKALHVLKKLSLLCSLLLVTSASAESNLSLELDNYLTTEKNLIFDFEEEKNELESNLLQNSWISPVTLTYQESWSTQYLSGKVKSEAFSIGIDQPIFKSGGIYYQIKYANALRGANRSEIASKKREMIAQAVEILFNIKKTKLQRRKLLLLVENDRIDVHTKRESYEAGLIDSSTLDQAILQRNQDRTQLLDVELSLAQLYNSFKQLSRKNPDKLKTPTLKLIALDEYTKSNLELATKRLRVLENEYNTKLTWTQYLPTVTASASYTYLNTPPTTGTDDEYTTYGLTVSMPISINAPTDIESKRVSRLKSIVELQDKRRSVAYEYRLVRKSLDIINRRITLAASDARLYRNLYRRTKDLRKAGERTKYDLETMRNSLSIKRLDRQIYAIDKQLKLLELYAKIQ